MGWVSSKEFRMILRCVVHVLNLDRREIGSETSSSGFIPMFFALISSLEVRDATMFLSVDLGRFDGE